MTLAELMERHRTLTTDDVGPEYFVSDSLLTNFLNEAVAEAAIRGRLLHESADPAICQISVEADTAVYSLHSSLYELDHVAFRPAGDTQRRLVKQTSQEWLDANVQDWRDAIGDPEYLIQADTTVRLIPRPERDGVLLLEGYRTPKEPMADPTDTPEINGIHHLYLVEWSKFRTFSIEDSELYTSDKAAAALATFEAYFGRRPDADLRHQTREDTPQTVTSFMP